MGCLAQTARRMTRCDCTTNLRGPDSKTMHSAQFSCPPI